MHGDRVPSTEHSDRSPTFQQRNNLVVIIIDKYPMQKNIKCLFECGIIAVCKFLTLDVVRFHPPVLQDTLTVRVRGEVTTAGLGGMAKSPTAAVAEKKATAEKAAAAAGLRQVARLVIQACSPRLSSWVTPKRHHLPRHAVFPVCHARPIAAAF
jgi:hypothetical protein